MNLPIKPKYQFTEEIVNLYVTLFSPLLPKLYSHNSEKIAEEFIFDPEGKYKKVKSHHDSLILLNSSDLVEMINKIDNYLDNSKELCSNFTFVKTHNITDFVIQLNKFYNWIVKNKKIHESTLFLYITNKVFDEGRRKYFLKINEEIEQVDSLIVYLNFKFFKEIDKTIPPLKASFNKNSHTVAELKKFLSLKLEPLQIPDTIVLDESEEYSEFDAILNINDEDEL